MIKVLVVDDSAVIREFLVYMFNGDPGITVVGTARNGEEALAAVSRLKPDILTMDIHMPKMDGLEATRRIMETQPTPIVVVSGSSTAREVASTFHAIEAGALCFVPRPKGIGDPDFERTAKELVQTVKLMAEVKVVKRWPRHGRNPLFSPAPRAGERAAAETIRSIAIGSSTGGPMVLKTLLSGLRRNFPAPLLIVQHMSPGFVEGFVAWLEASTSFPVRLAAHGEHPRPGNAYIAPDGFHLEVVSGNRIVLNKGEPENGMRPSVSCLFRSVGRVYGKESVGVLLTGMGRDGAEELKIMKEQGAVTIAQNEETCVVYGMPGEAAALGAALYVLSPEEIAILLNQLVNDND